jgi:hypothetical protein
VNVPGALFTRLKIANGLFHGNNSDSLLSRRWETRDIVAGSLLGGDLKPGTRQTYT